MGIKKFIKKVKVTLGLDDYEIEGKKKALKDLLKKLNERKKSIKNRLKSPLSGEEKGELEEEFKIVSLQLKKGKKILHGLYAKKISSN